MVVVKNSVSSIVVKKVKETGTGHAEFRDILMKFDLRIRGKFPFLIS